MQNAECRMNAQKAIRLGFHSALCILHSAFPFTIFAIGMRC